ncbi:TPA: hypothetical protein MN540_005061 [Klebsiella pneumoniae]|nr:hypothetical protein [Klebsiella pneumoniae]
MNQPNLQPRNLSAAVRMRLQDIEAWLDAGVSRTEIAETLEAEYGFSVTVRALDQALYRARKRKEDGLRNPKYTGLHNPKSQQQSASKADAKTAAAADVSVNDAPPVKTLKDEGRNHFTRNDFSNINEETEAQMGSVKQSIAKKKGF